MLDVQLHYTKSPMYGLIGLWLTKIKSGSTILEYLYVLLGAGCSLSLTFKVERDSYFVRNFDIYKTAKLLLAQFD